METTTYYQSPVGILKITAKDSAVRSITFVDSAEEQEKTRQPRAIRKCIKQLNEYFEGKRKTFGFPYKLNTDSEFQQKVWAELEKIPFGKTISYKQLALQLNDEKLVRAVGAANGKNPLAIVVPCHRVIGSDGKLVGYAGGLWRKQWLLEHEQKLAGTQEPSLF
ncbi:MAG: methylated-DNA--[protein]-cysteine S-methyltransferase [Prevotellaceae bacterium]|jgi:methylated-DNA-[protein]-cysteine S-methyltransferase|nr:methylated-DNA--[protein]-cysteine S-methyltransferase [Prevotellaceae bacterium]